MVEIEMMPLNNSNHAKDLQRGDREVLNGPLENRRCRDVLFMLLFCLNVLACLGVGIYGYILGRPGDLLGIYNDQGRMCSKTDFPLAYMPGFQSLNYTAVCVKVCPTDTTLPIQCLGGTGTFTPSYKSISIGDLLCSPTEQNFSSIVNLSFLNQILADLKISYVMIIGAFVAAFILGFLYFMVLRCCAALMIWLSILIFILGLVAVGVYMFLFSKGSLPFQLPIDLSYISPNTLQIISYCLWGLAGLTLILVGCCFNRIRLSIAVIRSTSMYLSETISIVLFSPLMAILLLASICMSLFTLFFLYSYGDIVPTSPFAIITHSNTTKCLLYYLIAGQIWIMFFVSSFHHFLVSSSACIWYFNNSSGETTPHKPLSTSLFRGFRYHFGSIAFGSLLLSILFILKVIVAIFSVKAKATGTQVCVTRFILRCCECWLWCTDAILKFLHKGVFAQMAIKGSSYCQSVLASFRLFVQNPLRLALTKGLSSAGMLIGQLMIGVGVGVASYYVMMRIQFFSLRLTSPIVPTIICALVAYLIARMFMSVFKISCMSILQCFIIDEMGAQEEGRRARYCPGPLRDILGEQVEEVDTK